METLARPCVADGNGPVTFVFDLIKQWLNTAAAGAPAFTGPAPCSEVDTQGQAPSVPDQQVTFFEDIFACSLATASGGGATWAGDVCP